MKAGRSSGGGKRAAGSSATRGGKKQRTPPPPRRYVQCPVCSASIPAAFLDQHVAACVEAKSRPTTAAAHGTEPEHAASAAPAQGGCSTPGGAHSTPVAPAPAPAPAPPAAPAAAAAAGKAGSAQGGAQAKSGFDVLMQAQRAAQQQLQPQQHEFYLELTDDAGASSSGGTWRCHWRRAGASKPGSSSQQQQQQQQLPTPVWSASVAIKEKPQRSPAGPGSAGPSAAAATFTTTITLHTNVPPGAGGSLDWCNPGLCSNTEQPREGRWRGHPSALKSALQKAVRRGMAGPAVRIALQMLKDDPGELLRRLPVIFVEDAIAHPHAVPVVVWLMAAQAKGYQLGALHATALLEATYQLARVKVRDHLPTHPPTSCPGRPLHSFSAVDAAVGGAQEALLCKSLLLRAQYGGMACDVDMLKGYAQLWAARFAGTQRGGEGPAHSEASTTEAAPLLCCSVTRAPPCTAHAASPSQPQPPGATTQQQQQQQGAPPPCSAWFAYLLHLYGRHALPPELSAASAGAVLRADIPLAAIDFHVSDIVAALMALPPVAQAAHAITCASWGSEGDAVQCLRDAMWLLRSSVNCRAWLPLLPATPAPGAAVGPAAVACEHQQLVVDLEQEAAQRDRLQPLWRAAEPHADRFAAALISKRFAAFS